MRHRLVFLALLELGLRLRLEECSLEGCSLESGFLEGCSLESDSLEGCSLESDPLEASR